MGGAAPTVVMPGAPAAPGGPSLQATVQDPQSAAAATPASSGAAFATIAATRYAPVQKLGEGGMGEVVLSRDQTIGREVAVKRLKLGEGRADVVAAQFLEEVKTTGRLEHPGIVPIYDAGQDAEGNPYFVMKYLDGEPLDRIIAKLRAGDAAYLHRFSYEHRTQIFMQLLHAVQYAHKKGVLHLDIKPQNVMVGPFGEVVLVDWGIARSMAPPQVAIAEDGTPKPIAGVTFTGTPDYMSPEQAQGKVALFGPHTDTYCLSVLFYEFVTLHYYLPPKRTLEGRLLSILIDEPLSGLQMHHKFGAPPELTNFIRKGLNKDPAQRYRTADEMVDALQQVMDGLIPVVCPCTGIKRVANTYGDFMNAHPILSVACVVLFVLFALFGVVEAVRVGAGLLHAA